MYNYTIYMKIILIIKKYIKKLVKIGFIDIIKEKNIGGI